VQDDIWKDRSKLERKIEALFDMKRVYIALLLTAFPALAELKLPNFFSDGMVLQRDTTAKVWGWTEPNAPVKLSFSGEDHGTRADQNGDWKIVLKGLKANSKGSQLVVEAAGSKRVIKDVLVGEVWLASGQSNMEWRVSGSANAKEEIAKAKDPLLRVFVSANVAEHRPQKNWQGNWKATQPQDTGSFTAVGYYFAKKLRAELGVPVGVIECAWGGKPVQAFTSEEALGELPAGKKLLEMKAKALAGYDSKKVD
jgi:sialate O-acetylesterase